jgi:hypothetical protein
MDAARDLRLRSLLLDRDPSASTPSDVAGVVEWFGAMQAQELHSGLWSLGSRLPTHTRSDVEAAIERREALRTWPMRGTVHFVPPRDARWMLALMGVRALKDATKRREYLGLSQKVADQAVDVLGAALAGGGRMTRAECMATLKAAGVEVTGQLGYHLLWYVSQQGVTCIGPNIGNEQTFVLLDEWVTDARSPERDEALGIMARRYFRSHGPASRKDFAGWTGLLMADVDTALCVAGRWLESVSVEGVPMYVAANAVTSPGRRRSRSVKALAGFDEYLLGYKDRSLMVADEHKQAIIPGGNGMFAWTIVRGGQVIATWKRTKRVKETVVDVLPLVALNPADRRQVELALEPYGRFTEQPIRVRWP